MGAADIVPGVSGGTIALITGIYEELITSIDRLNLGVLTTLYKQGFWSFWSAVNGPFLLPLFLGIMTSILFMSSAIDYLLVHHIILWSFLWINHRQYPSPHSSARKKNTHYPTLAGGGILYCLWHNLGFTGGQ